MNRTVSHTLAAAIGFSVAFLFKTAKQPEYRASPNNPQVVADVAADTIDKPGKIGSAHPQEEHYSPIQASASDLESWAKSFQDDTKQHAEALVISGVLMANPQLIRDGIAAAPENSHLLFIGATDHSFDAEERLAYRKRLYDQSPDNSLSSYLYASTLFET